MGVTARYLATGGAILCLAAVTASAGVAGPNHEAHAGRLAATYSTPGTAPLATALVDPWLFSSSQRASAFALSRSAGATYVRIGVPWRLIAPTTRPSGFDARDPTSPGYSWAGLDATIEEAAAAQLTPILSVSSTPHWAFATRPKLLCLDEPLTGLNQPETTNVLAIIRQLRDQRSTSILFVEHNVRAVMDLCDRIVVLDQGRKLAEGIPADIRRDQAVIRAYLGDAE